MVCLQSRQIERNLSGRGGILRISIVVVHLEFFQRDSILFASCVRGARCPGMDSESYFAR